VKRRDGLTTLLRRVGDAQGTSDGDVAIATFAILVVEARDTSDSAALAKGLDLALDGLERDLSEQD